MTSRSVVFAEPVRTAIGTFGGSLKDVPAPTLGAVAISGAVARAGLRQDEVETVVMGNVVQAGEKMNPARPDPYSPCRRRPPHRYCRGGFLARPRQWLGRPSHRLD